MSMNLNGRSLAALAIAAVCISAYFGAARAGDISPPGGAVTPTMTTLGEVGEGIEDLTTLAQTRPTVPGNLVGAALVSVQAETGGAYPQDELIEGIPIVGLVYDLRANVENSFDEASGLPTGKRQHKPFTITKSVDASSPLFMQSLTLNENLISVRLGVFRPVSGGGTEHFYTVELTNANVVEIDQALEQNSTGALGYREYISFTYQTITWTYVDGGITAEDDWETPVVR
jgi:type VI secretion system secreted protein Hcp